MNKDKKVKSSSYDRNKSNTQREPESSKTKASNRRVMSQAPNYEEDVESEITNLDLKKPRRPFNFFIKEMFSKEQGAKIESKYIKSYAKQFKSLSEKEKNKYREMAEQDRERYNEHTQIARETILRQPDKQNKTALKYFIEERRSKAREKGEDEIKARDEAKEKWREMTDEQKEAYELKSNNNKLLYAKYKHLKNGPTSAFQLYIIDKSKKAKKKGKSIALGELAKKWEKVKESEKKKYEDMFTEQKNEYEQNKDVIDLALNIKPKRNSNFLGIFMKDKFANGELKSLSKAKKLWDELNEEEKEKYKKRALKEKLIYTIKKQYHNAMLRKEIGRPPSAYNLFVRDKVQEGLSVKEAYKLWKGGDMIMKKLYQGQAEKAKEEFMKREDEIKARVYDKPKRALGAFSIFMSKRYNDFKEKNDKFGDMISKISEQWRNLPEKQKDVYEKLAQEDYALKQSYKKQFEDLGYYIPGLTYKRRRAKSSKKRSESAISRSKSRNSSKNRVSVSEEGDSETSKKEKKRGSSVKKSQKAESKAKRSKKN
jgi:HMG-box domain/HMG (high mobility group) box